jgi:hypothetical protein
MSRRDVEILGAWFVTSVLVVFGVACGLQALGARDELTVVLVIGAYACAMLIGSFVLDRYTSFPRRR